MNDVVSSDLEPMVFDLEPIEVPVKIGDKQYVLKEADGGVAARFENRRQECMTFSGGKPVSIRNAGDLEPFLVAQCLYEVKENGEHKPVTERIVRAFTAKVQSALFQRIKRISGIDAAENTVELLEKQKADIEKRLAELRESGDPAGNEQSDTMDGSDS